MNESAVSRVGSAPVPGALKLKRIGVHTFGENVAFLSAHGEGYHPATFASFNKIEVNGAGRRILATLNIVENGDLLERGSLGLSPTAFDDLGAPEGIEVTFAPAAPARSLEAVRRKIMGEALSDPEMSQIIKDIVAHRYSKSELTAFLVACAAFLTSEEVLSLTRAMAAAGNRLDWTQPPLRYAMVVDKHCIGGIPGNRTSMIVVPIVAAHGLPIPKTSSRAITSPAGTADTMEVIANVDVSMSHMREIVAAHGGCLVWGGHVNLSPADDLMIAVERPLAIDTPEQMVASILSKKIAAGSTHLVVDIPVGPSAKVRTQHEAARLRKLFEYVGHNLGLHLTVLQTDGTQPVGRGIGPVLEARDVMAVLRNAPDAPRDLKERAIQLAGAILDFDPALKGEQGEQRARFLLESGAALRKMEDMMAAQGPPPKVPILGALVRDITAARTGTVVGIDCFRLARIARLAGAPLSKGAGIDLFKKVGDPVKQGEALYRIHSELPSDLAFAVEMAGEDNVYAIG
ncbi:MAG: thymidine phosphorylase family protein [Rhodospirillaceae bacterium]